MSIYDFDLFTIGAGSGGVAGSRRAASYGARVAICEESRIGGTCVVRGCVPKKLLSYGASFADAFEDAPGFGWTISGFSHDWGTLMAAKNKELVRLEGIYGRLLRDSGVTVVQGRGTLVDAHTVAVGDRTYTAERIMIATGSTPKLPAIPGIELAITSNEALEMTRLPPRVAIVGSGYISVEQASIFNALGSKVTLFLRGDAVLRGFDEEIRVVLREEMEQRGIEFRTETQLVSIEKTEEGRLSLLTHYGDLFTADMLLYAIGRRPNSDGLNLKEVGVAMDKQGGIIVDENSVTNVPSVYAVGDVTNRFLLTPVAIREGRAIAETLYNNNPTQPDYRDVPTGVFSFPPVGTVGLSEEEARRQFSTVDVYTANFRPMKATLSGRAERVHMKLVVDAETDRVLGCHMVGPDAPEIIQGMAIALKAGATKAQFDATIGIHPSSAEEFVTMRDKVPAPRGNQEG